MAARKKTVPQVVEVVPVVEVAPTVMPEPPTKAETPGLKSFFSNYWQFIVWGLVFLGLVLNNTVFKYMGALTYLPLLAFGVFLLAFIMRHILNKTSTGSYVKEDAYDTDFASLPARDKVWLTQLQFGIYIIVIALLASSVLGDENVQPEIVTTYTASSQLDEVDILPEWSPRLDKIIAGMVRDKDRYLEVQKMRAGGVPWFIVGGLHERESSRNFTRHLHEGSPLIHRTYYVPKNRPRHPEPPYTWPQSAEDALYILKHEDKVDWKDTDAALDAIEQYNGTGYRRYHPDVPTPYLWSGSDRYKRGKYVADGRFDRLAVDKQAGVASLWKRMLERGIL